MVLKDGDINFTKVRPTDLKFNTRIHPPVEATKESEAEITTQVTAIKRAVNKFLLERDQANDSILSERERQGQKLLERRVKNNAVVISYTDKDGKIVVCPPALYIKAANAHLQKDEQVDWTELKSIELLMNRTAIMLEKMFAVG